MEKQLNDGVVLFPLSDTLKTENPFPYRNYWKEPPTKEELKDLGPVVLTNPSKFDGAALILNSDVLQRIHQVFEANFYIFPTSVHEVIIIPDNRFF